MSASVVPRPAPDGNIANPAALTPRVESYAKERGPGERFGDFVLRTGRVAPTTSGANFPANLAPELSASAA